MAGSPNLIRTVPVFSTGVPGVDAWIRQTADVLNPVLRLGTSLIRGSPVTSPLSTNDGQALVYDASSDTFVYRASVVSGLTQYAVTLGGPTGGAVSLGSLGTAGQVLSSDGPGVNPSWVNAGSVSLGTTNHALQVGSPTGGLTSLALGTDGQIPVGATGADPAFKTLSGDVGSITAAGLLTLAKINSSTVPAGGSLTTGNVLQVTGAAALGYAAVNLAGGANFITGLLPLANLTTGAAGTVLTGGATPSYSASPTLTGLTLSGFATAGAVLNSAAGLLSTGTIDLSSTTYVSNRLGLGNFSQGTAGQLLQGGTPSYTATPSLGVASSSTGSLTLLNAGGAGSTAISAQATALSLTFQLPAAAGSSGQFLQTNGSGVLSWQTAVGTTYTGDGTSVTLTGTTFGMTPQAQYSLFSGSGVATPNMIAPSATSGLALVSGGSSAYPSFGALNLTASGALTNRLPLANLNAGSSGQLLTGGTPSWSSSPTVSGTFTALNLVSGVTSTASTGGAITLTVASTGVQRLTGTTGQTYTLPDATTLTDGWVYYFVNNTNGTLIVNANGGGGICNISAGGNGWVTLVISLTSPGTWIPGQSVPPVGASGVLVAAAARGPYSFNNTPSLGVASTTTGSLQLFNSGGAGSTTISAAATASTLTFALPSSAGTSGNFLKTDGSGNLSWDVPASTTYTAGTGLNLTGTVFALGGPGGALTATSGGIPYFSSTSTLASSALLTNHGLMVGGGAGAAPAAMSDIGTLAKILQGNASGNPTWTSTPLIVTLTAATSVTVGSSSVSNGLISLLNSGGNGVASLQATRNTVTNTTFDLPPTNGSAHTLLHNVAGDGLSSWAQVDLTADVTGVLPVANGGGGTITPNMPGSITYTGDTGYRSLFKVGGLLCNGSATWPTAATNSSTLSTFGPYNLTNGTGTFLPSFSAGAPNTQTLVKFTSPAIINDAALSFATFLFTQPNIWFSGYMGTDTSIAGIQILWGLINGSTNAQTVIATPATTSVPYAAIRWNSALDTTNFQFVTCDGAGTLKVQSSGIAVVASHYYSFSIDESNVANNVVFFLADLTAGTQAYFTQTLGLPSSAPTNAPFWSVQSLVALTAKSASFGSWETWRPRT